MQFVQQVEEHFFKLALQGISQIHFTLRDVGTRVAWLAKRLDHSLGKMSSQANGAILLNLHTLIASQRLKIFQIESEVTVARKEQTPNLIAITILAIGSQPHDLALVAV